ncbi:MAG: BlaI/MecI/CopY family transcriptional regulator [Clostridia bacterium]|nr:BlaI/MecI/CopY family transcriptional regulator [Clostridia bacterium]
MSATERLPNAELDIMRVLWKEGRPLKASELTRSLSEERDWKRQTVHVLLARLQTKGYVGVDKSAYSHLFYATITQSDYIALVTTILVEKANSSIPAVFESVINSGKVSKEDMLRLADIINEKCKHL